MSVALALMGQSVLTIDMDPQANATVYLGVDPDICKNTTTLILEDDNYELSKAIVPTGLGVDLVPAHTKMASCNTTLMAEVGRETRLRSKLDRFTESFFSKKYDYVIIDCCPAFSLLTINSLMAATDLIVPLQPKYFALKGLADLGELLGTLNRRLDPRIRMMGILFTMYDGTAALDRVMADLLTERITSQYGDYVFPAAIHKSVAISESEKDLPIVARDPESPASKAYCANAAEILRR
jgi:chromosome partitioning protein